MRIIEENNNIILENAEDFDCNRIFDCGQCFRWTKTDNIWRGIAFSHPLKISQTGNRVIFHNTDFDTWQNIWSDYFDIESDYSKIRDTLSADNIMKEAVDFGKGIRILNQEPFECLISFIISASNNIPRIRKIIDSLCVNFGDKITFDGEVFYTFPTPERLSALTTEDLSVIRAGFRDKYILNAAKCVANHMIDLNALKQASYDYAKSELLKLSGVGTKVSDCILLFSLGKHESFPVDVWIKRIMEYCYFDEEQSKDIISKFASERFGRLGGYAQQYLFYWARENKIGI